MNEFYKASFGRLDTLLKECARLQKQRDDIDVILDANQRIALSLQSYLKAELKLLNDEELLLELKKIVAQEQVPKSDETEEVTDSEARSSLTPSESKGKEFNKTHFIIKTMQSLDNEGVAPVQLFKLIQETDKRDGFKLAYINNVLGKLKFRGLVIKKDSKYFLTKEGIDLKTEKA